MHSPPSFFRKVIHEHLKLKTFFFVIVLALCYFGYQQLKPSTSQSVQYQTQIAEKGTLVVSISASGQVSSANSRSVSTNASGVVKKLFVKDGDTVTMGQKLIEIELDQQGQQKVAAALSSYQSAKSSVESAKANMYTLQSKMFAANQKFIDDAVARSLVPEDPTYIQQNADWLASEALYKNQQTAINQAQNSLSSAWLSYQQSSPIVYAPISGRVSGLSLQQGTVIDGSSTASDTNTKIASIVTDAAPMITLSLTEVDIPKVSVEDKATITFDAFADKTYSGKVVSVDSVGSVSSGVTTYPVSIVLDTSIEGLFPNMAATANIITQTKDDVLLVPLSSVTTTNGQSTIQVMVDGQIETKTVEVGVSSDTQVEIISGLEEGDTVVTSTLSLSSQSSSTQSRSVFSTLGGNRTGAVGGATFRRN